MSTPNETLRILSILHFVFGGLTALFACLPLIHIGFGIAMLNGVIPMDDSPKAFGWLFILVPGLFMLAGWALAILVLVAGRYLGAGRHRTFCLVVAAIECMMFPFGTALGVATLVLLLQDEVAARFEDGTGTARPSPPAPPPPVG